MQIYHRYIPQEVLSEYNSATDIFDSKGYAYLEICKWTYGVKEAAILAYNQIQDHLVKYGHVPFKHTTTTFCIKFFKWMLQTTYFLYFMTNIPSLLSGLVILTLVYYWMTVLKRCCR